MKIIMTVVCALLLASCTSPATRELKARHSHHDPAQVKRSLSKIVIPEADFRNAHVLDALVFWSEATVEMDPEKRGANFVFDGMGCRLSVSTNLVFTPPKEDPPSVPIVEMKVKEISSLDLLEAICAQADLVWWITGSCIMIRPRTEESVEQPAAPVQK